MMLHAVSSLADLNGLVQPGKFPDKTFPKPKRVTVLGTKDSEGEDAFVVQVVFPDGTSDEELSWAKVGSMVKWIRRTILDEGGQDRWPYVWVRREFEWDPAWQG